MNRYFFFATALYLLFVIYGSIVPLEFRNLPIETALNQFKNIRYLNLGAASRADWIANILLYIPLAFGASALFNKIRNPLPCALLSAGVFTFCLALAVVIEFSQLFFPPRTVSLNDLLAEAIGSAIGVLSWQFFGAYFSALYSHLLYGGLLSVRAAIIFYLLGYIALSLFPFDFATSFAELDAKLAKNADMVIFPFAMPNIDPVRFCIKLLLEILIIAPLGFLFCYLPYLQHRTIMCVLVGFFLGIVIETVQIFLLSGSGQGISILTRMLGMGTGAFLFAWIKRQNFTAIMHLLKRIAWFAILPYLVFVLSINGGLTTAWLTPEQALEKLAQTHFLPLYYFYYTSESTALVSLLSNVGVYLPVGLFCWAGFFSMDQKHRHLSLHWFYAGLLAAALAIAVEIGKLFLAGKHADPSDVWLAFIAASACYAIVDRVSGQLSNEKKTPMLPTIELPPQTHITQSKRAGLPTLPSDNNKNWRAVSFLLWIIIAATLFDYPVAKLGLGLFLLTYTALLIRFPYLWLLVIPSLLPVMDFAPWTGRFFFDEFDLLILATLAVYFWRKPKAQAYRLLGLPTNWLLSLFIALYGISLLKGSLPLETIDANAFSNYYSNYNSLRIGKGVLLAVFLLPLLQQSVSRYRNAPLYLGYGVLLGLVGVIAAACWERLLFPGLLNFTSDFRIIALFSSMHTGGGHIDAYLALTLPFIALLFLYSSLPLLTIPLGIGLFITGLYVLLVTFSRGPYLAASIEFIILIISLLWCFKKKFATNWYKFLLVPVLLTLIPLIAIPVFKGQFIQDRFNTVSQDTNIRLAHWRDALAMRDDNLLTNLLGMGLGSYPRTYLWRNSENVIPAMYRFGNEHGNPYLKLSSGDSLYMSQHVTVEPHSSYRLSMDLRSAQDAVTLTTPICEKSLLYSFRCSWNTLSEKAPAGQWRHIEQTINSGEVSESSGQILRELTRRPVQLSLFNNAKNLIVDVDNVSLTDASDTNLIANGDFTHGIDHWFFSTDNHLPWHIKNLWVHILFDQGWLGVCAFFLLFAHAIYSCSLKLRHHNVFAAILLASFSGFMVVGLVDSPFDAPRLTFLFFLLLFLALMQPNHSGYKSTNE